MNAEEMMPQIEPLGMVKGFLSSTIGFILCKLDTGKIAERTYIETRVMSY